MSVRVIICERKTHWVVALRQQLKTMSIRLYQTRSLQECWDDLSSYPTSLLVLELTIENKTDLINRLCRLSQEFPDARAVVVAERRLQNNEFLLREAGAIAVSFSPRHLSPVASLIGRYLENHPAETELEQILERYSLDH